MRMIIILLVFFNCVACAGKGNVKEAKTDTIVNVPMQTVCTVDTLSIFSLKGKQYGASHYEVLHLSDPEKEEKVLMVTLDKKVVATIVLPKADDEVKNFSISGISETEKGFKVTTEWGGGRYFYGREFYFSFRKNDFYLDLIRASSFNEGSNKKKWSVQTIQPPIPIEKFKMLSFLENE